MSTLWNQQDLSEPPMCCTMVSVTPDAKEKLSVLKSMLQECVNQLSDQSHLTSEMFVLSSVVYKTNCQLRRDKALQGLKMIIKCLEKYSKVNMHETVVKLFNEFESYSYGSDCKTSIYLPSYQAMEHLMVKIMGVTCLLCQTVNYAVHTFILLQQRLSRGHLMTTNLVFLSAVSRIWAICKSQALVYTSWYTRLLPAVSVLTPTEVPWLPDGDTLPTDFAEFVYGVTGVYVGKRQLDYNLTEIFEKIENDYSDQNQSEDQLKTDEPGHADSQLTINTEEETVFYSNNIEDIGVPIKKQRYLKPDDEAVQLKEDKSESERTLNADRQTYPMGRKKLLRCVKKACSFDELQSILTNLKSHNYFLSSQLQKDFENSVLTVQRLKKKSVSTGKSPDETVKIRFLKKAKCFVRNLIITCSELKDSITEEDDNKDKQILKLQPQKKGSLLHENETRNSSIDGDSLNLKNNVKRKQLKDLIKMLRERNQFEYEGKIVLIDPDESEKLIQNLQQLLKKLKQTGNTEESNIKTEEILNEMIALLTSAAGLQMQEKDNSISVSSKKVKKKKKQPKKKKGNLLINSHLEQKKNLKKSRKAKTKRKKHLV